MLGIWIGLPVFIFVVGLIAAIMEENKRKRNRQNGLKDEEDDTTPTIMIGIQVPGPFDAFRDRDKDKK